MHNLYLRIHFRMQLSPISAHSQSRSSQRTRKIVVFSATCCLPHQSYPLCLKKDHGYVNITQPHAHVPNVLPLKHAKPTLAVRTSPQPQEELYPDYSQLSTKVNAYLRCQCARICLALASHRPSQRLSNHANVGIGSVKLSTTLRELSSW
jgi:hypothetical protein